MNYKSIIKKIISFKNTEILLFLILVISSIGILPQIYLLQYTFPIFDDYTYKLYVDKYGFWEAQQVWYYQWTGRYTGTFFLSLFTISFEFYSVFLLATVLTLFSSITIAIKYFFKINLYKSVVIALCFLTYIINTLPDVKEGLYWLSASVIYILPLSLFPFFLIAFEKANTLKKYQKMIYSVISAILLFLLIGFNESFSVILLINLLVYIIARIIISKQINYASIIILISGFVGFLILVLAPGNIERRNLTVTMNLLKATIYSPYLSIHQLSNWLFSTPIILLCFVFYLTSIQTIKKFIYNNSLFIHFKWNLLQLGISIIACNFLILYGIGSLPPGRMIDGMYVYFLFMILLIFQKIIIQFDINIQRYNIPIIIIPIIISLSFVGSVNFQNALFDILSDDAKEYHQEMQQRSLLLEKNKGTIYHTLLSIEAKPKSFSQSDITSDYSYWYNQVLQNYYDIDTLILLPNKYE
jgi:hypothetical protein